MRNRSPFKDENDFIVVWAILGLLFLSLLALIFANVYVEAAYAVSGWVTSGQVQKAEELGAIERTTERTLEVVNNYGEQDTYNPQIVGENR